MKRHLPRTKRVSCSFKINSSGWAGNPEGPVDPEAPVSPPASFRQELPLVPEESFSPGEPLALGVHLNHEYH